MISLYFMLYCNFLFFVQSFIFISVFQCLLHSHVTLNTWLAFVSFRSGPKIDIDQAAQLLTQH